MAIEYREIDANAVSQNLTFIRAVEAVEAAREAERELARNELLYASDDTMDKNAQREVLRASRVAASRARKRAARLSVGMNVDAVETVEDRRTKITDEIRDLESEHVALAIARAQRLEALEMTGINAPDEDEKERMRARLAEAENAIVLVEARWKVLTAELDSIPAPTYPVAPPDAPGREPGGPAPRPPTDPPSPPRPPLPTI